MTKKSKMQLREKLNAVINHHLMSEAEACVFRCYGDGIFTYDKTSLLGSVYEINFIPLDASTCVLESESIEQLLSIPCGFLEVILFDCDGNNGECLLLHNPKNAFDFNLN
jgi:hypothetical protein